MIYFAWISPFENFNESHHLRHDEDIFHLSLYQEEGKPAQLKLVIENPYKKGKSLIPAWGMLSYKQDNQPAVCLFRGPLVDLPKVHQEHFLILTFTAKADAIEKHWPKVVEKFQLKEKPFYDDLFDNDTPQEQLMGRPMALYWDRVTNALSLSHAFRGHKHWDLTPLCDSKELSYHTEAPLTCIKMNVSAQWVQHLEDQMDIAPFIAVAFKEGVMNTYTPKSLMHGWPKMGFSIKGDSGYQVVYSHLREIERPYGAPGHIPNLKLWQFSKDGSQKRTFVKRSWFKGRLVIAWHKRQKRKENIRFQIKASLPLATVPHEKSLNLSLKRITQEEDFPPFCAMHLYKVGMRVRFLRHVYEALQEHFSDFHFDSSKWRRLEDQSRDLFPSLQSSFFLTPRGYEAFEHALERAKTALTWGTRCFYVYLKGSMKDLMQLNTDHTASIEHPLLPQQKASGKIVKYQLELDGATGKSHVNVTLACRIGLSMPDPPVLEEKGLYAPGYASALYQVSDQATQMSQNLLYMRYDAQTPQDTFKNLVHFQIRDMIQQIYVQNPPQEQEAYLLHLSPYESPVVKDKETKIYVRFHRIHSTDCLNHLIDASVLMPWFEKE